MEAVYERKLREVTGARRMLRIISAYIKIKRYFHHVSSRIYT
jgi:hypothetical protein